MRPDVVERAEPIDRLVAIDVAHGLAHEWREDPGSTVERMAQLVVT